MIDEDLDVFFDDFGVEATDGTDTAIIIFGTKNLFVSGPVNRFKDFDYLATKQTKDLPNIEPDSILTIQGKNYIVIEVEMIGDGKLSKIYLNQERT